MIRELDIVALTHDIKEENLKQGDTGTVVDCIKDGEAFIVEFITPDGRTIGVVTLTDKDIRLVQSVSRQGG